MFDYYLINDDVTPHMFEGSDGKRARHIDDVSGFESTDSARDYATTRGIKKFRIVQFVTE